MFQKKNILMNNTLMQIMLLCVANFLNFLMNLNKCYDDKFDYLEVVNNRLSYVLIFLFL
jgi:hypothetical protein